MPRTIDLPALRAHSTAAVNGTLARYVAAVGADLHYLLLRWIAQMSAVEVHATWERYAESRLVAALNHHPEHFLAEYAVRGVTRVPAEEALQTRNAIVHGRRPLPMRAVDRLTKAILDITKQIVAP